MAGLGRPPPPGRRCRRLGRAGLGDRGAAGGQRRAGAGSPRPVDRSPVEQLLDLLAGQRLDTRAAPGRAGAAGRRARSARAWRGSCAPSTSARISASISLRGLVRHVVWLVDRHSRGTPPRLVLVLQRAELVGHAPLGDHVARQAGGVLDVRRGARADTLSWPKIISSATRPPMLTARFACILSRWYE